MRVPPFAASLTCALLVAGFLWSGNSSSEATVTPRPLQTAVFDPIAFPGADAAVAFAHSRETGATLARLFLDWGAVAAQEPSSEPTNPANPAYDWSAVDRQVKLAVAHHLQPILDVFGPPTWARKPSTDGGPPPPELRDPADVGRFMRAAARRYSGTFGRLPRVRYWQVWNEPNLSLYLSPQYQSGDLVSPAIYRQIVNSVADAVHAVHKENVVIAGAQSPFATDPRAHYIAAPPIGFMQSFFCLSSDVNHPKATCNDRAKVDVWAHHPYTAGGPETHAQVAGNVSLGDLPEMKRVLNAAERLDHIDSHGPVRFWVTEFSWDSNPTDPGGVPAKLEAQWVAEGMYNAWRSGVSLFTWFLVHENPWSPTTKNSAPYQSSLFQPGQTIAQDKPKPALAAFRFPFVGHVVNRKVSVWGRTPWGRRGKVLVEESSGQGATGWKRLGVVATDRYGIFTRTFGAPTGAYVRARLVRGRLTAPPFPLAGPEDMKVQVFG